jgi:S1-C subfamily serine protease
VFQKPTKRLVSRPLWIIVAALCLVSATTWARGDGAGALPPEMRRLEFLVGRWVGTVTAVGPAWTVDFQEHRLETTRALQGSYLMMRSRLEPPSGQPVELLQLLGYDPAAKRYRLWMFKSDGSPPDQAEGRFQGERLVLTGEAEAGPCPFNAIGLMLEAKPTADGTLRIYRVLPKQPAAHAKLKTGDRLHRINGRSVLGMTELEAEKLFDGKPGTTVRLTVQSGEREREITLTCQSPPSKTGPMRITFAPRPSSGFTQVFESRIAGEWHQILELTHAPASGSAGEPISPRDRPEMKRLEFLTGHWEATVSRTHPAWSLEGGDEGSHRVEVSPILGADYLMLRSGAFANQREGRKTPPIEVLDILGYDSRAKRYQLWTFASNDAARIWQQGAFQGERLVLTGEAEVTPGMASDLGIQLEVKPTPEGWRRIYRVLPKGAAARAGLKSGDLIHRIEGRSVRGMPDAEVYRLLDGKPGTRVRLIVPRGGREADGPLPQEVTLTRQPFTLRKLPLRTTYEPRNPSGFALVLEARIGEEWQRVAEYAHRPARSSATERKP